MSVTRLALLLPILLAAATPAACGARPEPEPAPAEKPGPVEWQRPYVGYLPGLDEEKRSIFLVRDARTGRPIQGAAVTRHLEMEMGADGWAPELERAVTDEFGLAWIRLPDEDAEARHSAHYAVRAEGYAPTEEYGALLEELIELDIGRDLHGRVVDALGRPAAHMEVEYKVGCGHAPALRRTRTDGDGVFVLPGIEWRGGEAAFFGPGVLASYFDATAMRATDQSPPTFVAEPGVRIEGRIVGVPTGALEPGIVHSPSTQRGSIARVAEDGHFVLEGCEAGGQLALYGKPGGGSTLLNTHDVRPGGPVLWNPRSVYDDGSPREDEEQVIVERRVHAVDDRTGEPVRPVSVFFDRETDGRRIEAFLDREDKAPEAFDLPAGSYLVSAGAPTDEWAAPPTVVRVEQGNHAPVVVRVRRRAALVVTWQGEVPEEVQLSICLADDAGRIVHDDDRLADWIPHEARAVLLVETDDHRAFTPIGASDGTRRIARPAWPKPTHLRWKAPTEGCRFDLGGREIEPDLDDGRLVFETRLHGRLRLGVTHEDGRRVSRLVVLPRPNGGEVDLGTLALPPERTATLTVLDAAGQPAAKQRVAILYTPPSGVGGALREELTTDASGRLTHALLRAGADVVLENRASDAWEPRSTLAGPGPYEMRLGGAAIEVTVRDEKGAPVQGVILYVDGELFEAGDDTAARTSVRGLAEGAHTLIVAAPGRGGEARGLLLEALETRRLDITLLPRR